MFVKYIQKTKENNKFQIKEYCQKAIDEAGPEASTQPTVGFNRFFFFF